MKEIITSIINEWDPVGIKAITPDDEYDFESGVIESAIAKNADITEKGLAEVIKSVFVENFGEDVFTANKKDVEKIASKILTSCRAVKEKQ